MITKLNEKAMLSASEKAYRTAVIRKINQVVDAINTGVVWDNKVKSDRDILNLQGTIVELEYQRLMEEGVEEDV